MDSDRPLSTREIADSCGVSTVAVWKWIRSGKLQAFRLPNGHYRVQRPVFRAFLKANQMPVDPDMFGRPHRRVLVIDDEPSVVEIVCRAVEQIEANIEVATATDGFEAGLQAATFRPDLLILDLMMPRVDGFAVCRSIKSNAVTAHMRILVISAFGSHDNIERVMAAGADAFLHKPVEIGQFKEMAINLLEKDI